MGRTEREKLLSNLYQNVKHIAKEKGIMLGDLEKMVGLSTGYLSRNRNCSAEKISMIADRLGTTMETLLSEPHTGVVTKLHDFFVKLAVDTKNSKVEWFWSPDGICCNFVEDAQIIIWMVKEGCYCVDMICHDKREHIYNSEGSEAIPYLDNAVRNLYSIAEETANRVRLDPHVKKIIEEFIAR